MNEETKLITAPFIRRLIAFIIDAAAAFFPAFAVMLIILETPVSYHLAAPLLYAAPIEGTASLIELPLEVNQVLNDAMPSTDEVGSTTLRNVTTSATLSRILSVFAILFYLFYSTVCALLFDGVTVGKYCMGIQTVYVGEGNPTIGFLLRELLGKIVLNSLGLFVVSIITMIVTPKHFALHDFIGKTRVVYTTVSRDKKKLSELLKKDRDACEDEDDAEDEAENDDPSEEAAPEPDLPENDEAPEKNAPESDVPENDEAPEKNIPEPDLPENDEAPEDDVLEPGSGRNSDFAPAGA